MAALSNDPPFCDDADAKAIRDEDYALTVGTGTIEDYGDDWFTPDWGQPSMVVQELCQIIDRASLEAGLLADELADIRRGIEAA